MHSEGLSLLQSFEAAGSVSRMRKQETMNDGGRFMQNSEAEEKLFNFSSFSFFLVKK